MGNEIDHKSGDIYGALMLTGKSYLQPYCGKNRKFVECICECGKIYFSYFSPIKRGIVISCGCRKKEGLRLRATKHGFAKRGNEHQLYSTWATMIQRCTNSNSSGADLYFGRGIKVYPDWLHSSEKFITWSLENGWAKGLSIDRIDNEGGYEPSNCRWVTDYVQSRNRRNNNNITIFGETKCLKDWSLDERCKVAYTTVYYRVKKLKWDSERAITQLPYSQFSDYNKTKKNAS